MNFRNYISEEYFGSLKTSWGDTAEVFRNPGPGEFGKWKNLRARTKYFGVVLEGKEAHKFGINYKRTPRDGYSHRGDVLANKKGVPFKKY